MMEWLNNLSDYLIHVGLPAVLIGAVGILIVRICLNLVTKLLENSKMEPVAYKLILKVLRVAAYVLLSLVVASKLGIDVSGIVALASVLTLAVSLSVQDLLTNLISGFTLLYTKPFDSDDFVEIAGQSGTVLEIGLTYTKLTTPDNKIIFIPNGSVTSAQIVNYTANGTRRVDLAIQVSYDMEPEKVIAALIEAGSVPAMLEDHVPFAAVQKYGESTVEYVLQVWSATDDYWKTLFEINKNIKAVFAARNIQFSFPHVNVHFDKLKFPDNFPFGRQ